MFKRDARFEARNHVESFPLAVILLAHFGRRRARLDDFKLAGWKKSEIRRRHADNRINIVVQRDAPAEDLRIAAEPPLPQAVTENQRPGVSWAVVVEQEGAT